MRAGRLRYDGSMTFKMPRSPLASHLSALALGAAIAIAAFACSPTVKVQAPKEPITINLNIKLDADVRVRLEEVARKDIAENPDIF